MTEHAKTAEVQKVWEAAAPGWAKWEAALSAELTEATDTMIDLADVRAGMRVLDLACGAGIQSLRLAQRVGAGGSVLACDISPTMLDHVRQNAARAGYTTIKTLDCAAEDLGAEHGPFDAAICRFGLMLFPAPGAALQAVRAVLRPGARFAALVFATPEQNPVMAQPMAILLRHAGKAPPQTGQPGLFALGPPGVLTNLMEASGFAQVAVRPLAAQLKLASADEALAMMQEALGAYRAVVADLDPEARARAWAEIHACLRQFEGTRGFTADLGLLVAVGVRPA